MQSFVHLHVHSGYSLKQGALRLREIVELAKSNQMSAVALTDTNALYGVIPFYKAAKSAGIKPIIGVQLSVGRDETEDMGHGGARSFENLDTAIFLAKNFQGYQSLVELVTIARARTRNSFITFCELSNRMHHLFVLIGGGESRLLKLHAEGKHGMAQEWLTLWMDTVPKDNLFIDIQDHKIPHERAGLPSLVKSARAHSIPLVATNDVHYATKQDAEMQRVLASLDGNAAHLILQGDTYEFASSEEMNRRFAQLPEALANTVRIADACELELPLHRTLLPKYPTQNDEPSKEVLRRAAQAGVRKRYGQIRGDVSERLEYELGIINQLGFADYFLVVADFIRFAHKQNISTGPGRGSAAGSIVAYALRITDVDPIENHLLFERFLNPERITWPDIDTDFEFERRGEVIQYVKERYGTEYVAQIGTFGTLAARAAIRDAGRVLNIDPKLVDRLARLIPSYPGITLAKAMDESMEIRKLLESNQHAKTIWTIASQIEGLPRHTSIHAAGVVISPIPLSTLVPVQPGSDGIHVTQYPMEDIESLGLVKMDFLGLKTLTLIDACVESVRKRTGTTIDLKTISQEDALTFKMLSKGETLGCFQMESAGIRRVLRELKPSHFEDITAVISLYRPGPMENIPAFVAAKNRKQAIHYPHEDLQPILEDTYGVIVYQEQIMQIASLMAGFSLGQSDLLRRAVSKKKRDILDAQRNRFVTGSLARGYSEQIANEVYDLIVRFADYGFNRSHASAYAVLSYRTAYLRANYLPDFLAALLTMDMGSSDKVSEHIRDAKQHGIQVLPPSATVSQHGFVVESDLTIRAGLLSVKGVGRAAADAILAERNKRPFASLVDFLARINNRVCNRKVVESLLEADAFSSFLPAKATIDVGMQMLSQAYDEAEEHKQFAGLGLLLNETKSTSTETVNHDEQVLYIRYTGGDFTKEILTKIKQLLLMDNGKIPVVLYDTNQRKTRILGEKWRVQISPELMAALEEIVGIGNVKVGRPTKRITSSR